MKKIIFIITLNSIFFSIHLFANEWRAKGQAEFRFENRIFQNDNLDSTKDYGTALYARLESKIKKGSMLGQFSAFSRSDSNDQDRSIFVIEDLWIALKFDSEKWRIKFGFLTFNWTATEAFHPADIINSRNIDSDIENLEKKGEFTIQLERTFEFGALKLFLFPIFTENTFPGNKSRLGFGFKAGKSNIINSNGDASQNYLTPQGAIQFDQTIGSADVSLHYVNHIDRTIPIFTLKGTTAHPNYLRVQQFGGTYQQPIGQLLFKLEFAYRNFENHMLTSLSNIPVTIPDHSSSAVGFEYTLINENQTETTLILEGQSVLGVSQEDRQRIEIFSRDILLGVRHIFNDLYGKEFFVGYIQDLTKINEFMITMSYSQRLSDEWKINSGIRYFKAPPSQVLSGLEFLNNDHNFYINISRFL